MALNVFDNFVVVNVVISLLRINQASGSSISSTSHIISVSIIAVQTVHFPPLDIRSDGLSRHSHRSYALGKLHPHLSLYRSCTH